MEKESAKQLERDILRKVCEYLTAQQIFFWRTNNIPVFGMSNDGKKRFRSMPKYARKGVPDICVVVNGRFIGLEVKRPGGKRRPEQEDFAYELSRNGGIYYFVTSVADVADILP